MFSDRLEIENPGGLYGRLTINDLGKIGADTRNPYLTGALEVMRQTENRYSGIPTVRLEMKKYNLPEPRFINFRGAFKAILYNSLILDVPHTDFSHNDNDLKNEILEWCASPRSRKELAAHFGFDSVSYFINKYIVPLIESGEVNLSIPDAPKSRYQRYYSLQKKRNVFQ